MNCNFGSFKTAVVDFNEPLETNSKRWDWSWRIRTDGADCGRHWWRCKTRSRRGVEWHWTGPERWTNARWLGQDPTRPPRTACVAWSCPVSNTDESAAGWPVRHTWRAERSLRSSPAPSLPPKPLADLNRAKILFNSRGSNILRQVRQWGKKNKTSWQFQKRS